jgi:dTDP-4-dehydrorhamnose reductase
MKVLIIGSNGQLGSDLVKVFSENKKIQLFCPKKNELNLIDENFIAKILNQNFEYIINCSAIHDLDFAQKNIDISYQVNSYAVEKLAEFCNKNKTTLIHFSTDYVFDGFKKKEEYIESDFAIPLSIYGSSKLSGEFKIKSICKKYYIFRVSSLFGSTPPSGKKYNFVDAIINKFRLNEEISVVDDQVMKPTATAYIAEVISQIINKPIEYNLYHLTNDLSLSWYDYANLILSYLQKNILIKKIKYADLKFNVQRPKFSSLSSSMINNSLKLNNSLNFYLENYLKSKKYVE